MFNFISKVLRTKKLLYSFILLFFCGAIIFYNNADEALGARTQDSWMLGSGGWLQTVGQSGYNILINGVNKYLNFGSTSGTSGYGFRDNSGTIEYKNSGGSWAGVGSGGTSTSTEDGSSVYVDPATPGDFGTKVNNAYASLPSTGGVIEIKSGATSAWTVPIVFATAQKPVKMVCDTGAVLSYTPSTGTSTTFNITSDNFNSEYGMFGCYIYGPDLGVGGTTVGLSLGGSNGASNITIEGNWIIGFGVGVKTTNNIWNARFIKNQFTYNDRNIHISEADNSGENMTFIANNISDCNTVTKCFYSAVNGAVSLNLTDNVFDDAQVYLEDGNSNVTIKGGDFENPNSAVTGRYEYIITGSGGYSNVTIDGVQFSNGATSLEESPYTYILNGANLVISNATVQSFSGISSPSFVMNYEADAKLTVNGIYEISMAIDDISTSSALFLNDTNTGKIRIGTSDVSGDAQFMVRGSENTLTGSFENTSYDATLNVRSDAAYGSAFVNLYSTADEYGGISGWIDDSLEWRVGRSGDGDGVSIYTLDGNSKAAQFKNDLTSSFFGSTTVTNLTALNCDVKADGAGGLYCGIDAAGGGGMIYPGAGIPLSTGSAWGTSITNNSANWNTAYGWGNHATAGYETQAQASSSFSLLTHNHSSLYDVLGQATSTLGSHTTTYNHANYNTAYGWGNHALAGYETQAQASSSFSLLTHNHSALYDVLGQATSTLNSHTTAYNHASFLTSVGSDSTWTTHNSYPAACSAGQYVTAIGDTLTCSTPPGGGAQTPWTSNIDGGGYSLTNVGTATTTNLRVTGKIGVGTAQPGFDIDNIQTYAGNYGYATIGTRNLASDGWSEFALGNDVSAYAGFLAINGSTGVKPNSVHIGASMDAPLYFWSNNTINMTLDPDGNLGINDESPSYKLDVNGDFRTVGSTTIGNLTASNCDVKASASGGLYCGIDATAAGGAQTPWSSNINAAGYDLYSVGKIGIGTSTPRLPFHVKAPSSNSSAVIIEDGLMTSGPATTINSYGALLTLGTVNESNDFSLAYINASGGKTANYLTNSNILEFDHYTTGDAFLGSNGLMAYGGLRFGDSGWTDYYGIYKRSTNQLSIGKIDNASTPTSNPTPYIDINTTTGQANFSAIPYISTSSREVVDKQTFYTDFMFANAGSFTPFFGAAVSSGAIAAQGTNSTSRPGLTTLRDSTTAGGGYYVMTQVDGLSPGGGETYEAIFNINAKNTRKVRLGFQDSITHADPTDGMWLEYDYNASSTSIVGRTAKNNTRSTTTSGYVFNTSNYYRGTIEVNSALNLVTFSIYNSPGSLVWTNTLSTNIPNTTGNALGCGVGAYEVTTSAAATLVVMDYMEFSINRLLDR